MNKFICIFICVFIFLPKCYAEEAKFVRPSSVPSTAVWNEKEKKWSELKGNGELYAWYDTGEKFGISQRKNGLGHGKTIQWYKNGQVELEIFYINGLENGIYRNWWENGNIKAIETYKNGKLNGYCRQYDESGNLQVEEKYSNDVLISKKIVGAPSRPLTVPIKADWDFSYKLWIISEYDDMCRCYNVTRWFPDGKLEGKGSTTAEFLKNGKWTYYRENGTVKFTITYKNGKSNGPSEIFDEKGQKIKTINYKNGREISEQ